MLVVQGSFLLCLLDRVIFNLCCVARRVPFVFYRGVCKPVQIVAIIYGVVDFLCFLIK